MAAKISPAEAARARAAKSGAGAPAEGGAPPKGEAGGAGNAKVMKLLDELTTAVQEDFDGAAPAVMAWIQAFMEFIKAQQGGAAAPPPGAAESGAAGSAGAAGGGAPPVPPAAGAGPTA